MQVWHGLELLLLEGVMRAVRVDAWLGVATLDIVNYSRIPQRVNMGIGWFGTGESHEF